MLCSDLIPNRKRSFFSYRDELQHVIIYSCPTGSFFLENTVLWIVLIGFVRQLRSLQESKKTVENIRAHEYTPLITVLQCYKTSSFAFLALRENRTVHWPANAAFQLPCALSKQALALWGECLAQSSLGSAKKTSRLCNWADWVLYDTTSLLSKHLMAVFR